MTIYMPATALILILFGVALRSSQVLSIRSALIMLALGTTAILFDFAFSGLGQEQLSVTIFGRLHLVPLDRSSIFTLLFVALALVGVGGLITHLVQVTIAAVRRKPG